MAAKKGDSKTIEEMHARKSECKRVFGAIHAQFKADKRFMLARDGQWDATEKSNLGPNATQINRMKAYLFQILNAFIRQDIGCDVTPSSEGAALVQAQVRQAQVMKLWDICNGREMLADACKDQLAGGFGVMGMRLKYANNDTFDQILQFFAVLDCTKFYWDLSAQEPGYADMKWCLHEEKISKSTYESRYGSWDEITNRKEKEKWEADSKKRVFEYWRVRSVNKRTVYLLLDSNETIDKSEYDAMVKAYKDYESGAVEGMEEEGFAAPQPPPEIAVDDEGQPRSRTVFDGRAEQFIIANDKILQRHVWPIGRIPYKVIPGRKYVEDDKLYLQSMGMDAQAPQRKYNFIESQKNLLYSKGPTEVVFVPAGAAMGELVNKLQEASRNGGRNVAVIPFVTHDEEGNLLPAPVFKPPVLGDPFLTAEAEAAIRDIEATFGMIQEGWLNRNSNASGVAIRNSEMQAQNSMFDYPDAAISSLQEFFRDIMEILPKISMPMQIKLAGEDMKEKTVWVNNARIASNLGQESVELDEEKYSLTVKARPSADTMRQKSFEEMDAFAKRHPDLADAFADLDAKDSLNALHAEEISKRLRDLIAEKYPSMFQNIDPANQALRSQLEQAMQALEQLQQQMVALDKEATEQIAKLEIELKGAREDNTNEAEKIRIQAIIDQEKIRQGWAKLRLEEMKAQQQNMQRILAPVSGLAGTAQRGSV